MKDQKQIKCFHDDVENIYEKYNLLSIVRSNDYQFCDVYDRANAVNCLKIGGMIDAAEK